MCKDVDAIMGDFTSTILLAIDTSDGNLIDMARRIQEKLHADLEHVQVSGVDVQREMAKEWGRSGLFLFVNFTLHYLTNFISSRSSKLPSGVYVSIRP